MKNILTQSKDTLQLIVVLVTLSIFAAFLSKGVFIQPVNLTNILVQNSILMIVALGQFLIILSKGIDLNAGNIVGFSSVIIVLTQGYGTGMSIGVTLAAALVIGGLTGCMVHFVKLPAFVVTLAMSQIVYSITKVIGGGAAVYAGIDGTPISPAILAIYSVKLIGIPLPVLLSAIAVIFVALYLKTTTGHFVYAVGGNEKTAAISGLPIARVKISVYLLSAALGCMAALMFVARVGLGDPQAGDNLTLDSIAAVTVGGASLSGGVGKISGAVIGVLILGVLNNILNLLNVPPTIQPAIKGGIILLAVYLNSVKGKKFG